jgi:hypothetical protein
VLKRLQLAALCLPFQLVLGSRTEGQRGSLRCEYCTRTQPRQPLARQQVAPKSWPRITDLNSIARLAY